MFYVEINKQVESFLPLTRASTSQLHFLSHHLKKGKVTTNCAIQTQAHLIPTFKTPRY
jgi:hypothetical protein